MDKSKIDLKNLDIDYDSVAPFRHKKFDDEYLITNEFGYFYFLKPSDFKKFLEGNLESKDELYKDLKKKGFIRDQERLNKLAQRYVKKHSSLQHGPGLHIVVVTLRCNYKCIYCQASSKAMDKKELDMSQQTAKKVVDRVFETTSNNINIEFQGGEPLVNWDTIEFIVKYAREKEKSSDKDLSFSLVSNLSFMSEQRLEFLIQNGVSLCTSLDGPKELQNKNRPFPGGDSYKEVVKWVKKYRDYKKKLADDKKNIPDINALLTVSRFSLNYPEKIIDEYRRLDFNGVHLRPLSYLGYSGGPAKEKIGYSAEEFLDYWRESMDYILEINQKGEFFSERGSRIMLTKILTDRDSGYTDLASPCGACIGQVVYDYNGDLYTCDEGRMLEGDEFKLGNVDDTSYEEMISSDTCKTMLNASTLENQSCDLCVYKPYCGVCPVKNYALEGTLFPQMQNTDWCKTKKAQLDYLFSKLKKEENRKIFKTWVENKY